MTEISEAEMRNRVKEYMDRESQKLNQAVSNYMENSDENSDELKPKIQRIPMTLRGDEKRYDKYYVPKWVSIGPIHCSKPKLRLADDRYKLQLVGKFVHDRISQNFNYKFLHRKIWNAIFELKTCIDEKLIDSWSDEVLAWVLFVDGCFILQFIHSYVRGELTELFKIKRDQMAFIRHDLFLVENQIPFRVLRILIEASVKGEELKMSMKEFIMMNMMTLNSNNIQKSLNSETVEKEWENDKKAAHLLDLLRMALLKDQTDFDYLEGVKSIQKSCNHQPEAPIEFVISKAEVGEASGTQNDQRMVREEAYVEPVGKAHLEPNFVPEFRMILRRSTGPKKKMHFERKEHVTKGYEQQSFRSVTDLKAAGITLKPSDSYCVKDVKFTSFCCFAAKLELPTLIVDDSTAPKLLNLIAYEMLPDNTQTDFEVTSYVHFLDSLIDYASDVKELRSARILRNFVGCDEEVTQLFNEIGRDTVPNTEIYNKVILEIEKHYKNKCMTWVAQFLNEHFNSPWSVLAFFAAILALALTGAQTWFAINPQSDK